MYRNIEDELVRLVQQGDSAAFDKLIEDLDSIYHSLLYKYVFDREQWDDIKQELLMKTHSIVMAFDFDKKVKFTTFLYTCLKNFIYDIGRKEKTRQKYMTSMHGIEEENWGYNDTTDNYEEQLMLESAVDKLEYDDQVIIKAFMTSPSRNKAADSIGMPRTTFKRKLDKALNKIKEYFGENIEDLY